MFNMYNFGAGTYTDELVRMIEQNAPLQSDNVKKLYDSFDNSNMLQGERYYRNESDILQHKIYSYVNGVKVVDTDATNRRIPSGMHKILVDQKVGYLAGEPMSFGSNTGNNEQTALLSEIIGERWKKTLVELIINASNKGVEWLHPYIDEDGEFKYMLVGGEQFIPIYDTRYPDKLVAGIRFYYYADDHIKLELWTDEIVTYYEIIGGDITLDVTREVNPAPHFTDAEGAVGKSWGKVPFIRFQNNSWELSDLHFNKVAIDEYEQLLSKGQNTIFDVQELIYVLKGYDGSSLSEFQENLRRYKAVKVDEDDGGIDTLTAAIPTDAYVAQAEMLRKNIITSGQGVDPSPDVIGDAPSGRSLEFLYSLLDFKASMLEQGFELSIRELLWFVQEYCELQGRGTLDYRDVTMTFNKVLLTTEQEVIEMAVQSEGIISRETIVENHPWVKDVEAEMKRIEKERDDIEPLQIDIERKNSNENDGNGDEESFS